jgi:alcohol dehydrogenase (cytochrome c)
MHTRKTIPRPGSDPNAPAGIMKINMDTGQFQKFYTSKIDGQGAMLATAGDLLFWGDWNRRLRAFDADSGKILWETVLAGNVDNSTITYSVNGKQYVAVLTGDGTAQVPGNTATIYVFALP